MKLLCLMTEGVCDVTLTIKRRILVDGPDSMVKRRLAGMLVGTWRKTLGAREPIEMKRLTSKTMGTMKVKKNANDEEKKPAKIREN